LSCGQGEGSGKETINRKGNKSMTKQFEQCPSRQYYHLTLTEEEAHAVGYSLRHTQSIIRQNLNRDDARLRDMADRLESAYQKLDTCEITSLLV